MPKTIKVKKVDKKNSKISKPEILAAKDSESITQNFSKTGKKLKKKD